MVVVRFDAVDASVGASAHVRTDASVFSPEHDSPFQKKLEERHSPHVLKRDGSGAVLTEVVCLFSNRSM